VGGSLTLDNLNLSNGQTNLNTEDGGASEIIDPYLEQVGIQFFYEYDDRQRIFCPISDFCCLYISWKPDAGLSDFG
jgi:hypothetical protein